MAERTRANTPLRGFLAHSRRIDLAHLAPVGAGATDSSYSAADPRPGVPEPADERSGWLALVHHAQDADLRAVCLRAGSPGSEGDGGVGYREESEGGGDTRGWNEPNLVHSYEPIEYTTTEDWFDADAVTVPETGRVVAIACDSDGTATEQPSSWRWDPKTRAWDARVETSITSSYTWCCLVRLRSGRLVAYAGAGSNCDASFSDDDGETWAEYTSLNPFGATGLAGPTTRVKMALDRTGAIVALAVDSTTGDWQLFRSEDDGFNFVETFTGTAEIEYHSMATLINGEILLAYRDINNDARYCVLQDAYSTLPASTALDGTNNIHTITCAVDDDGAAYIVWMRETSDKGHIARSLDNGATFELYTHRPLNSAGTNETDRRLWLLGLTFSGGSGVLVGVSAQAGTTPASDGSLLSWELGGWSTIEATGTAGRISRYSFGSDAGSLDSFSFWPSENLENQNWAQTGTAHDRPSGKWRWNPVAATSYHQFSFGVVPAGARMLLFEGWRCESGGSQTTDACSLYYRLQETTYTYEVALRADTNGFRLRDVAGGADVGAAVAVDMTLGIDVMLLFSAEFVVSVYYKQRASSRWNRGPQTAALTNSGGVGIPRDLLRVGCATATTTVMRLSAIAWTEGRAVLGLVDDSPYSLRARWGHALGARPYGVRDQGGDELTYLSSVGGAPRFQEVVVIPAAYDHGVREILPQLSPSPAARWRSIGTAEQSIVFDLGSDTRLGPSWALAMALLGANFRTAFLEVRAAAAGAWTTLGTYDAALGPAGATRFVRAGNLLTPDTTGAMAYRHWRMGQYVGGHVILDPGGTPKLRRIASQSGGGWGPRLRAAIRIDGVDGTELTSGTCTIVAPSGVLVVHLASPSAYRYVRLRIPAQSTPEGYFELGQLVLGALVVPGRQWSRGFSWRMDPNSVVEADPRGTLWPTQLGDQIRELTVSWQDGYDQSAFRASPDAPYLAAQGGTPPLTTDADVQGPLEGLVHVTEGFTLPVVALSEVPSTTGMVLDPDLFLYGLAQGRVQTNHVQGDEGRSEVVRTESLTVRGQPMRAVP